MIPVTVTEHEAFRAELERSHSADHAADLEGLAIDAADFNPPSRRKDSEIRRVLEIIDNLPTGEEPA